MGIVKTVTIQPERYKGDSDLEGSEWTDRGRHTIPIGPVQLVIWQSRSIISLPKILRRLRHNVGKELDLHAANFLQAAGDSQNVRSKTTKASASREQKGLTPLSRFLSGLSHLRLHSLFSRGAPSLPRRGARMCKAPPLLPLPPPRRLVGPGPVSLSGLSSPLSLGG